MVIGLGLNRASDDFRQKARIGVSANDAELDESRESGMVQDSRVRCARGQNCFRIEAVLK